MTYFKNDLGDSAIDYSLCNFNILTALSTQYAVINEISQRIEAGIIDRSGELIQKLFIDAAKSCLSQKKHPPRRRKQKSKKWFDSECNNLKKQARQIGGEKHKKPHDTFKN